MKGRPKVRIPPCRFCNRHFKRQEHLQRHLRTHTQERPFQCFCGKMFSRQDLLGRHTRLEHRGQTYEVLIGEHQLNTSIVAPMRRATPTPFIFVTDPQQHSLSTSDNGTSGFPGDTTAQDGGTSGAYSSTFRVDILDDHPQENFMDDALVQEPPINLRNHLSADCQIDSNMMGMANRVPEIFQCFSPGFGFFLDDNTTNNNNIDRASSPFSYQFPLADQSISDDYENNEFLRPNSTDALGATRDPEICPISRQKGEGPPSTGLFQDRPTDQFDLFPHGSHLSDSMWKIEHWTISAKIYERLSVDVTNLTDTMPSGYSFPGPSACSRYLSNYFRGFDPHLPFLHLPTTSPNDMSSPLILALATAGAFYAFEHPKGYALYLAARTVISQKFEQRRAETLRNLIQKHPSYAKLPGNGFSEFHVKNQDEPSSDRLTTFKGLEIAQALIVLIQLTSWVEMPVSCDAFSMTGQLTGLVQEALAHTSTADSGSEWKEWCQQEVQRRTIFAAYIVLSLQAVTFNSPPAILNSQIHLSLPCSDAEWKAVDEHSWRHIKRRGLHKDMPFHKCLKSLMSGQSLTQEVCTTAFGNYVLVHGILQQIWLERHGSGCLIGLSPGLTADSIECFNKALSAWQSSWNSCVEFSMDPTSPYGPLGFNATAILRLAHIRLAVGLGNEFALKCHDPIALAHTFVHGRNPVSLRSGHLEQAVRHCIYSLSLPVRMGIAYVARTQPGRWSAQHAISNFSCALLLKWWLENIAYLVESSGLESLVEDEKELLRILTSLIQETQFGIDLDMEEDQAARTRLLAIAAVKIWAEVYSGIQVFEIVHVIGTTLSLAVDLLENRV